MTPYSANPFVFVFSAFAVGTVLLYIVYSAIDRMGLYVRSTVAVVTGKRFTTGGKTYYTNVVAGRPWVQSQTTPETYAVELRVAEEDAVGVVSKQMFEALNVNDTVHVKVRRTRLTRRLEVLDVAR